MLFSLRSGALTGIVRQFLFPRSSLLSSPSTASRSVSQWAKISSGNSLRNLRLFLAKGEHLQLQDGNAGTGPVKSSVLQLDQIRGMKTRSSVKRLCDGCKVWFI